MAIKIIDYSIVNSARMNDLGNDAVFFTAQIEFICDADDRGDDACRIEFMERLDRLKSEFK
jgi:hypothetical protein